MKSECDMSLQAILARRAELKALRRRHLVGELKTRWDWLLKQCVKDNKSLLRKKY